MPAKKKVEKVEAAEAAPVEEAMVKVEGDELPPVVPVAKKPRSPFAGVFTLGKHLQRKKSPICDPHSKSYDPTVAKRRAKEKARRKANKKNRRK